MISVQNVIGCTKKNKNGYVALCVITGFMKNASMNEDSIISISHVCIYIYIYIYNHSGHFFKIFSLID